MNERTQNKGYTSKELNNSNDLKHIPVKKEHKKVYQS